MSTARQIRKPWWPARRDGVAKPCLLISASRSRRSCGSIAGIDAAGALRVGPRSAGAVPGPASYGAGGSEPTLTDAHVVLGHLDPERFLGGRRPLDASLAEVAQSGVAGFEPLAGSPAQIKQLGPLLEKHRLEMRSLYVNSKLHDDADAQKSIDITMAYFVPDEQTIAAIHLAARTEGMLTDPVYEGKSIAGLIGMIRSGDIPPGSRVLYAHLGGQPALPAYANVPGLG